MSTHNVCEKEILLSYVAYWLSVMDWVFDVVGCGGMWWDVVGCDGTWWDWECGEWLGSVEDNYN